MHELVDVGGVRLRVSIRGRGRPLLLCNGIGASLELLDPLRRALTSTETIAVDMPGCGGSPATALPRRFGGLARLAASLLDVLGYDRVDVLGVSWGGALAQELALSHPARVRKLVLAATSPGWPSVPSRPSALWALAAQREATLLQPPSVRGYLWQLAAALGWSSVWRLHRIECPTLVLAADDDPIVPVANARLIAWRVPRSSLRVVGSGGHLFLVARAARVAPWIERFLADP